MSSACTQHLISELTSCRLGTQKRSTSSCLTSALVDTCFWNRVKICQTMIVKITQLECATAHNHGKRSLTPVGFNLCVKVRQLAKSRLVSSDWEKIYLCVTVRQLTNLRLCSNISGIKLPCPGSTAYKFTACQ